MTTQDLINRLRDTASKGVSVWGDLQMEAAKEIETLLAERECYASAMDRMQAALAEPSEAVAEVAGDYNTKHIIFLPVGIALEVGDKLFTHPASKPEPLPELTDDEIVVLYAGQPQCDADMVEFAREVLAAAREKAK